MNNLILIGAIGKNGELGKDNKLIWYLPEDLKFFKDNTINHTIVMGYNTFVSLPKLLIKRKHIVLTTRNLEFPESVTVFHNKESVLNYAKKVGEDIYIIGGASIYKQFINESDRLLLTEIEAEDKNADVYFPKFNKNDFNKTIISEHEYNDIKYKHVLYKRK